MSCPNCTSVWMCVRTYTIYYCRQSVSETIRSLITLTQLLHNKVTTCKHHLSSLNHIPPKNVYFSLAQLIKLVQYFPRQTTVHLSLRHVYICLSVYLSVCVKEKLSADLNYFCPLPKTDGLTLVLQQKKRSHSVLVFELYVRVNRYPESKRGLSKGCCCCCYICLLYTSPSPRD